MTLDPAEFIRRFLHPRAAERFPPHPPLRPVRQRRARAKHRARASAPRRARGRRPNATRAEAESEHRKTRDCAAMPVLRRPHDHHRNLRRRASCAPAIAEPDHDRHLMIAVAAFPASLCRSSSPPAAAGAGRRCPFTIRASSFSPALRAKRATRSSLLNQARRILVPIDKARCFRPPRSACPIPHAPSNPHRPRSTQQRPILPAVSSMGGFRTPAPRPSLAVCNGPASETLHHGRRKRLAGKASAFENGLIGRGRP